MEKKEKLIDKNKVLAIVFAPELEVGLVNRNLREVNGKPLLELAFNQVQKSKLIDQYIFACDGEQSASYLKANGHKLDARLVFKHSEPMVQFDKCVMQTLALYPDFDYFILIDVSYPLRVESDIDSVLNLSYKSHGKPVITIKDTQLSKQDLQYVDSNRALSTVFSSDRPDSPELFNRKLYEICYSAFASSRKYLEASGSFLQDDTRAYLIPSERSLKVESKVDLVFAEVLMQKGFGLPRVNNTSANV